MISVQTYDLIFIIIKMGNECKQQIPANTLHQSAVIDFYQQMPRFRGKLNFQKQSSYNKIDYAARAFCQQNEIDERYSKIISLLLAYGHLHYFAAFKTIPKRLRAKFVEEISQLQVQLMDSLYNHLVIKKNHNFYLRPTSQLPKTYRVPTCLRYQKFSPEHLFSAEELGLRLLMQKKVAVMIMMANSQERNGFTSKALENVPVTGSPTRLEFMLKKLYNILSRYNGKNRLSRTGSSTSSNDNQQDKAVDTSIVQPIIIVCNTSNEPTIYSYFDKNKWFGFDRKFIRITSIKNIPILNEQGKLCLTFGKKTIFHPQGSAKCLELLLDPNHQMRSFLNYSKTQYIHVLDCQNQLQCPGDPIFIGLAKKFQKTILAKCTQPQKTFDTRKRYLQSESQLHLMSIKEIEYLHDMNLLKQAPVALNSMVFQVDWLLDLANDYDVQLALSQIYHASVVYQDYYDFISDKPVIGARCYVFQKDIRDYICTSSKAQLIEYNPQSYKPTY